MAKLTLGQRIASRRKLLNLSQEALSEQLDVSRQAISKWESDTAIPEIDKLIALAKIFGVSVGWLLGVEAHPAPNTDTLTDTQLKMVEELVRRYQAPQKKHSLWKTALLILCAPAVIVGFFHYTRQQNSRLAAENAAIRTQIEEISADNADIQTQINQMGALLNTQSETGKLLRSYVPLCYLNDDLATVDISFYFYPKVYHENVTAYLSIFNPATRYNEMLECRWLGDRYHVHTTLPLADHYQYSFLLVSQTGYQEELLAGDSYYSDLLAHSHFYVAEENPKYAQMKSGSSISISTDETIYHYNAPIYIPRIFEKNGFVPFRDVKITLLHNGEIIWEEDYSSAFLELYKKEDITIPLVPDISVALPPLQEGDRLILELTATTFTERIMVTPLDDLTVTAH